MRSAARKKKQVQNKQKKNASIKNSAYIMQAVLQQSEQKADSSNDAQSSVIENKVQIVNPIAALKKKKMSRGSECRLSLKIPTIVPGELNGELVNPNSSTTENPIVALTKNKMSAAGELNGELVNPNSSTTETLFYDLPITDHFIPGAVPLTPGSNINFNLLEETETRGENILLDLWKEDATSPDRSKKVHNLKKRYDAVMKQNARLQKENEELRKLNIFYQKRNIRCTCNAIPQPSETQLTITAKPTVTAQSTVSEQSSLPTTPTTLKEFTLSNRQIALLDTNVNPTMKDGALVGDLAVMVFPMEDLVTKTAKQLDEDKVTWMIGK